MKKLSSLALMGLSLTACASSQEASQTVPAQTEQVAIGIDWSKAGPDAKKYQMNFTDVEQAVADGAVFYDVRSKEEYDSGNFGITESFPLTDMEAGKLPDLPKDTPIYVHCLKGIRSAQAAKILRDAGFTTVYDMGGLEHVEAIGGVISP
ncbi:rhodanese-like domain-containing protein [Streptococcus ovuberis]|uniref:Rhodanese-like domain-containing protein n=1 Tax=Streptococcus ovuberis TaxID=1936207 RepID=A0A7X6MXZ0_9STRE|nr:rhodanese-like domain-containing protein [Streptococcus ovuberis]NKZ20442.1 rhodanese-like domain-containing protein [Streptococcus ovuberis]